MILKSRWIITTILLVMASFAFAMLWIYQVDPAICNGCARCIPHCPTGALSMHGPDAVINPDLCDGCGDCLPHCIRGAIYKYWYEGISSDEIGDQLAFGPNPTSGPVFVTGAGIGSTVEVFDLTGRLVASAVVSPNGEAMVDLTGLASGNYRIQVGNHDFRMLTLVN